MHMHKLLASGLLATTTLLAACATTTRWDKDYAKAPEPVKTDWDLTKQRCTGCHSLERVFLQLNLAKDRGDVEWMVQDMAAHPGSGIRQSEIQPITDTLDWHRTQ